MGDDSQSTIGASKEGQPRLAPFTVNDICVGPFTLAAGDLNVHLCLWYEHQVAEQRVETVEVWLVSRNASILNNGEPTHAYRATGGLSILDVTMVNGT